MIKTTQRQAAGSISFLPAPQASRSSLVGRTPINYRRHAGP
jgi:hypothetical protein